MWAMVSSFGPADPADAPVGLLRGLAQLAVGGLLVRGDHSPSNVSLVGDPSGGVDSVEQSGGVQGGHVVHGPRIGGPRPTPGARPAGPGSGRSCQSSRAHRDHNSR